MAKIKLSTLKLNESNPRFIKDDKFLKLCNSIQNFPKMMELRPIIIDDSNIILGGNMRFKALQELGYKEVDSAWIKKASDLSEAEKREFVVKDNVGFGDVPSWLRPFNALSNGQQFRAGLARVAGGRRWY